MGKRAALEENNGGASPTEAMAELQRSIMQLCTRVDELSQRVAAWQEGLTNAGEGGAT